MPARAVKKKRRSMVSLIEPLHRGEIGDAGWHRDSLETGARRADQLALPAD